MPGDALDTSSTNASGTSPATSAGGSGDVSALMDRSGSASSGESSTRDQANSGRETSRDGGENAGAPAADSGPGPEYLEALMALAGPLSGLGQDMPAPGQPGQPGADAQRQAPDAAAATPAPDAAPASIFDPKFLEELAQTNPELAEGVIKPLTGALAQRDKEIAELKKMLEPIAQERAQQQERQLNDERQLVHGFFDKMAGKGWKSVYGESADKAGPEGRKIREAVFKVAYGIFQNAGRAGSVLGLKDVTFEHAMMAAHELVNKNTIAALKARSAQRTPAGAAGGESASDGQKFSADQVRERADRRWQEMGLSRR